MDKVLACQRNICRKVIENIFAFYFGVISEYGVTNPTPLHSEDITDIFDILRL